MRDTGVRQLDVAEITAAVASMCIEANYDLPDDVYAALGAARASEASPTGRAVLGQLIENADIAREDRVPICQDTGLAVLFVELGQDVHLVGGDFEEALHEGVRRGYTDGYLRKSSVMQPGHDRINTRDNTPAIIHTRIVPGDKVWIAVMPKGGGAENMSSLNMLKPAQGAEGIVQAVVDTVSRAGSNPCPPVVIGVGIGGTIDRVTLLAKHALLREIGSRHPDPRLAAHGRRDARAHQRPRHRAAGPGRHARRRWPSSSRRRRATSPPCRWPSTCSATPSGTQTVTI